MANSNDFSKKVTGGNPLPVKANKANKIGTGIANSKGVGKKSSTKPSLKGTKGMKGKRSLKPKSLQPIEERRKMD